MSDTTITSATTAIAPTGQTYAARAPIPIWPSPVRTDRSDLLGSEEPALVTAQYPAHNPGSGVLYHHFHRCRHFSIGRCSTPLSPGSRARTARRSPDGACWAFIQERFHLFIYGFYPEPERWRSDLAFILLCRAIVSRALRQRALPQVRDAPYACGLPAHRGLAADRRWFALLNAGRRPDEFGGIMLTLVIGITGISFSLPLGILLALGRQLPELPVIKHALRLLHRVHPRRAADHLLFVASTMLNYFLPPGTATRPLAVQCSHHGHVLSRLGLHRRGGARRPAGDSQGPVRGGPIPRPQVLEGVMRLIISAPGPENLDPGHRQQLHSALQGHHPGAHHRAVGPAGDRPLLAGRHQVGRTGRGDVRLRRALLLHLLLQHVALLALPREEARNRPQALRFGTTPHNRPNQQA